MFTNALPLILVLLLINLAPTSLNGQPAISPFAPGMSFLISVFLYSALLLLIYFQNKIFPVRKYKREMLWIINAELILFLYCFLFVLWGQLFIAQIPYFSNSLIVMICLGMYLGGLAIFHSTIPGKFSEASTELRLLSPFALPFLFLVIFMDFLVLIPNEALQNYIQQGTSTLTGNIFFFVSTITFLVILMIFLPYLLQKIWNCRPLNSPELEKRLSEICQNAHFHHAGFKLWTILENSLTAAIIGIIPQCRYILFTPRLFQELPTESVEAILAHEIGHSKHKHLLIYPFIFFGLAAAMGLLAEFVLLPFIYYLATLQPEHPHWPWDSLIYPLTILVPSALLLTIYFRYVFGLFSRLFERQADLYIFALGIEPKYMIRALDHIGIVTGHTHHLANWHHYGIQERINFLQQTEANPALVSKHERRIRYYLIGYFVLLAVSITILIFS